MSWIVATMIRAVIMALLLVVLILARGTYAQMSLIDRRALVFLILSGIAGAASWLCYFRALQLGDALRVAPIDRLSGGVTLVLAAVLLHERAPATAWFGTALMVIGAVIVAQS